MTTLIALAIAQFLVIGLALELTVWAVTKARSQLARWRDARSRKNGSG